MKELTKYLKFLFVSSVLLLGCTTPLSNEEKLINEADLVAPMTREDSIIKLAHDLNIEIDHDNDNVHTILNKILEQKKTLISRLDSLSERADQMERVAYEFKKKEDARIRRELLSQIDAIKGELERIKQLAREKDIKDKDDLKIPEKEVDNKTKTFEDLEPGNYITRVDKKHLVRVYVTEDRQIIISKPILDSTTILRTNTKISPRMEKELKQIRDQFKSSN